MVVQTPLAIADPHVKNSLTQIAQTSLLRLVGLGGHNVGRAQCDIWIDYCDRRSCVGGHC